MAEDEAPEKRRSSGVLTAGVIGEDGFDKRVSAAYYLKSMDFMVDNEAKIEEQIAALDAEIAKIPEEKKKDLMAAQGKDLVQQADKIYFLRAEEFDAVLAAERLRQNWETRVELFGDELAFEPLTLDGALRNDTKALETGFAQVTTLKDDAERGILFLTPSRFIYKEHDVDSMVSKIAPYFKICMGMPVSSQYSLISSFKCYSFPYRYA